MSVPAAATPNHVRSRTLTPSSRSATSGDGHLDAGVHGDEHADDHQRRIPIAPRSISARPSAGQRPAEHRAGAAGLAHGAVAVAVHRPAHGLDDPATVERGAGEQVEERQRGVGEAEPGRASRRTRSCWSRRRAPTRPTGWRRRSRRWSAVRRRRSSPRPSGVDGSRERRATPPSAQSWIDSVLDAETASRERVAELVEQDRDQEGDRCRSPPRGAEQSVRACCR